MPFNQPVPATGNEHQTSWFSFLRTAWPVLTDFINLLESRSWSGTQAQYDALPTKDDKTTYNIIAG